MSVSDEVASSAKFFLALAAALCVLVATGCSDPGGGGQNNGDDNDVCQYECFADYRCEGGVVYEKEGGPIPCSAFGSQQEAAQICADREVTEYRTCAEGCRTDVENISQFPSYTSELCAEDRLVQPGDACEDDGDCEPTDVGVGPLECDQSSGTCVDPAAPEDAGNGDAGDAGDPGDTGGEDIEEDTQTEDAASEDTETEDTSTEDDAGDTQAPSDAADTTSSGDADDVADSDDATD